MLAAMSQIFVNVSEIINFNDSVGTVKSYAQIGLQTPAE